MHYRREIAETEVKMRKGDGERNNYLYATLLSHSSYTYPSSFFLLVMKVARCLGISKYTGFSSSATELEDDAFPKGLH